MADSKLSELTSAGSIGSSDLLYLVQGGASKKISFGALVTSVGNILATTSTLTNGTSNVFLANTGMLVLNTTGDIFTPNTGITLIAEVQHVIATTVTTSVGVTSVAFSAATYPRFTYVKTTLEQTAVWTATGAGVTGEAGVVSVEAGTGALTGYWVVTLNQPTVAGSASYTFSTDPHFWQFKTDGSLEFPHGMIIGNESGHVKAAAGEDISLISNNMQQYVNVDDNTVSISTNYSAVPGYDWVFNSNGSTVLPDSSALAPATSTSTGTKGTVVWDSGFIYVCVATNTWRRASLNSW